MPLIIPDKLPTAALLQKENIFTMKMARAVSQDIRPLQILVLNLMPTKIQTETQLSRLLANVPLQVEITLLRMDSYQPKNSDRQHLDNFYKTLNQVHSKRFDGMVLTGAPVELMPFEHVDYWQELKEILEYSKTNVYSSIYICWGAQAALYYYYGIEKHQYTEKVFGIYEHKVKYPFDPLLRGFDETFYAPHSRNTYIDREDIIAESSLKILAESEEAGLHILKNINGRQIFIFGHMEYDRDTLKEEYLRDIKKGVNVKIPRNYFLHDDPNKSVLFRWRSHAHLFFSNWLNYSVYQQTPFDLTNLSNEMTYKEGSV